MNAHLTSFYISESLMNKLQAARRKNGVMSCTEQELVTIEKHLPLWEVAYSLALCSSPFWKNVASNPVAYGKFAHYAHSNIRWDSAQYTSTSSLCYAACVIVALLSAYYNYGSLWNYVFILLLGAVGYMGGMLVRKMYLVSYLMLHLVNEQGNETTTAQPNVTFFGSSEPVASELTHTDKRVMSMVLNYTSFKQLMSSGQVKVCRDMLSLPSQKVKLGA